MITRLLIFIYLWTLTSYALADDLFATGWGAAFAYSSEGILVFAILNIFGVWTCLKSIMLCREYSLGKQEKYNNAKCFLIFVAGVCLYYAKESLNLIYNSIF